MTRQRPLISGLFYFMEIWKDVIGYEGLYQVSNLGNIKSLNYNHTKKEKLLTLSKGSTGYYMVNLYKNKKRKLFCIHQLVAITFLGHEPNKHHFIIDHINDKPLDNRVDNLQIVTQRFNTFKTQGKGTSKYKGVSWSKTSKKWVARIYYNGKDNHLGCFDNEVEASIAYQNKLKEI